ncbi:MAG: hypothetical protein ABSB65_12645 [Candidatus Acidiferrales bacterium]|jgi:hypothetical protein
MQAFVGLNLMAPWASKSGSTTNATAAMGIIIDVPFDLVVGTYSLAAGIYRFEALRSPTPGICVLAVRGEDGKVHKLAVSISSARGAGRSRSKLVFHRRDDRHFLRELWLGGRCLSLDFYRSLQEFDTEQENPETEVILLGEPDRDGHVVYVIEDSGCTA